MTAADAPAQPVGAPVPGWTQRPRPEPLPLTGRYVDLEPLTAAHAEDLHAALGDPQSDPLWTYLADEPAHTVEQMRAVIAARPADWMTFAVRPAPGEPGGGHACGMVSLLRIDPHHGTAEIGGILLARVLQRSRAATETMYLLARYVLDDLGYRRLEWKCDSLNEPSRAAAARLGFTYEGRFRQAVVYKGRNRDTDWFAVTDADWARLRPAHEAWLDRVNFTADGGQRSALSVLTAAALTAAEPRG